MKKKGLILALVMVLVFSLFATSFASSGSLNIDRGTGGMTTLEVPPRIIGW